MSSLESMAESLSGFAAFAGSAIFSGLLSIALTYPSDCEGDLLTQSCKNVLGQAAWSQGDAAIFSTVVGFLLGGAAVGIRAALLEQAEKRRAEASSRL